MLPSWKPVRAAISERSRPWRLRIRIGRRALLEHAFPEFMALRDLAGTGFMSFGQFLWRHHGQCLFFFEGAMKLTVPVDQPVACDPHQERTKMGTVSEPPARFTEPRQHVGPYGLDNVHRVELGAKRTAEASAHCHSQVRLICQESAFRGRDITLVQPLNQFIQRVDRHDSLEDQLPGSSGNPPGSAVVRE
jgi:hypothetical protein